MVPDQVGLAVEGRLEPGALDWVGYLAGAAPGPRGDAGGALGLARQFQDSPVLERGAVVRDPPGPCSKRFSPGSARGEIELVEALGQVARGFSHFPEQLAPWKRLHENLSALLVWAPGFERAREYLAQGSRISGVL